MRITLISFDNWGFNECVAAQLAANGHIVNHIDFHSFKYEYANFGTKIYNFFYKIVSGRNLKNIFYGSEIIRKLEEFGEKQDVILTLKGDFIDPKSLLAFKKYTQKSIGFFNDNVKRYPKIKTVLHCFDVVYSFEKEDCAKFNLPFATNWIYNEQNDIQKIEYNVFNITSKDKRLPLLEKIATALKSNGISYKIMVFDKKSKVQESNLTFIKTKYSLDKVSQLIAKSQTLLDINRPGQSGLSFRIFESLGLEKKLITTNKDVRNYDFYNPKNILIIDETNPQISKDFFESDYEKIPENIYYKYTMDGWIDHVIFDKKH
ncbi:hypothetical protein FLAN108750_11510 [Flavobacterium antarcticum]|uniref:hypothetical protein n=1 Tax=Flavobacterium antarcticum TaxID=271155 RepID=UPI0003B75428|nr:hypothetical protein [Flavobacterium antarcticum]